MAKSKDGDDVLSLLDSLGDAAPPPTQAGPISNVASTENEQEVLSFLDDLAKQPARAQTPRPAATESPPNSRDSVKVVSSPKKPQDREEKLPISQSAPAPKSPAALPALETGGGWLGGLWSMGTAAMKTAEQKVKELQQTEEAKAWEERVKENVSALGRFGTPCYSALLRQGTTYAHEGSQLYRLHLRRC
jgi:hypothetical protein